MSITPLTSTASSRPLPVAVIAALLVIVLGVAGLVALGLHKPTAPLAPYEKTVDVRAH